MLYWDVDLSETNVLFWWQKRTRKPPAIERLGGGEAMKAPVGLSSRQSGLRSKCRVFSAARTGIRRVAVPSVHFVPWAALVSCWPLPQQLLPVSAAGSGRRCCTGLVAYGAYAPPPCSSPTEKHERKKTKNHLILGLFDERVPCGTRTHGLQIHNLAR